MNDSVARVFDFRPPSGTKRVGVYGSWDNYAGSALTAGKPEGLWTVTVNIPTTTASQPNTDFVKKFWYYYLVDEIRDYDKNRDYEIDCTSQVLNHFIISIESNQNSPLRESQNRNGAPLPLSEIKTPTPVKPISTNFIRRAFKDESPQSPTASYWSESSSDEES